MPVFAYSARDSLGRLSQGRLEAASEGELALRLESQGLLLTVMHPVKAAGRRAAGRRGRARLRRKHLVTLTYNLETIYSAGIPLVEGLRDLAQNSSDRATAQVTAALAEEIRNGSDLAGAMNRQPENFPQVYRSVVAAGEAAGEPGPVLQRLAEYYRWVGETKASALRALTYPAVLIFAVIGLVVLLMTFLVPRILEKLVRTNASMPVPTKVLMAISGFLRDNIILLGSAAAALAIFVLIWRLTPRGRYLLDKFRLRLPVFGPLCGKLSAARFVNTLATLYRAGIGTVEALSTAESVLGNAFMADGVRQARERVVAGDSLSGALRKTNAFQPLVIRMISVGEQTGTLGEALDRVNSFYDREIPETINNVLSVLEPALIVGAGLVVGFILLCTFLPIFEMIRSIGA